MKMLKFLLLSLVLGQLVACSSAPERMQKFDYSPAYPVNIPQQAAPKNGSLFQAGGMTLFDDSRAHKVGDIITIKLNENFAAKKKDEAKFNKSNKQDYGVSTPLNIFGKSADKVLSEAGTFGIGYGSTGQFNGKSDVKQNSSLQGSIAVTVVEVIPNGNLVIRGEKWITIHDGEEVVRFAGIIRPEDISPDNTIDSTKVADVRLIYKDTGVAGDTARPGAVTKFLNKYWPL